MSTIESETQRTRARSATITVHAGEVGGRCFIDVFSCRPFVAELAAAVAVEHFGGVPTLTLLRR